MDYRLFDSKYQLHLPRTDQSCQQLEQMLKEQET
jgi:hypothetical protein